MLPNVLLGNQTFEAISSLGVWIHQFHLMLLVNHLMSEFFIKNIGGGGNLCVSWIQVLIVENGCVGEYIFFLFWPWNHFFRFCRYLSRSPINLFLSSFSHHYLLLQKINSPVYTPTSVWENSYFWYFTQR